MMEEETVEAVARWIRESRNTVVLTGQELSLASGVPDFTSPSLNPPIREFRERRDVRVAYWQKVRTLYPALASAEPNAAHRALADLEPMGLLSALFTQTVDGLHQRAGSSFVVELFSTMLWVVCTRCGKGKSLHEVYAELEGGAELPVCDSCGGDIIKPEIPFPGQPPPHWELREAWIRLRGCELFVAVGADLDAQPTSSLPPIAKEQGGRFVVIGERHSAACDYADVAIYEPPLVVLPKIVDKLKEMIAFA